MSKLLGVVIAFGIVLPAVSTAAMAMPQLAGAIAIANSATTTAVVEAQYYYKGHKYKRQTRQHFIRKYSGSDRNP